MNAIQRRTFAILGVDARRGDRTARQRRGGGFSVAAGAHHRALRGRRQRRPLVRLLGDKLAAMWGQQVVVEDKAGAGGLIGTDAAAKAPADGYTLYLATDGPLTVAATLNKHVPYDWKRDFAPVSMITVGYQILLSSPKLPATTLKEFIALAQQRSRQIQFRLDRHRQRTAPRRRNVPVDGRSQADACALSRLVAAVHCRIDLRRRRDVHGRHLDPRCRSSRPAPCVGSRSPHRSRIDSLPDIPTFAEQGLPKMDYSLWFALLVPSATPPEIVKKLNADIGKVVADPDHQKAMKLRGFEARGSTPDELAAFMQKDYIKNRELIQRLGLHVD